MSVAALSIVLYDGVCGFCDGAVRWLLAHERSGRMRFAPIQGETAAQLRERHPEIPQGVDTFVFIESTPGGERVLLRSEAIFRVLAEVDGPWRWLRVFRWLPRPLTDLGYRIFAKVRYRVFGRLDACRIPTPTERARFLT